MVTSAMPAPSRISIAGEGTSLAAESIFLRSRSITSVYSSASSV